MFVFVEEAAETVASADAQVRDGGRVGDRPTGKISVR
jgi:hypothetical protein